MLSEIITGNKYGCWTVLHEVTPLTNKSGKCYKCLCRCGNIHILRKDDVRNNKKGCVKCHPRGGGRIDYDSYIGKKYGTRTILEKDEHHKYTGYVKCICECGTNVSVSLHSLINGTITRCRSCDLENRNKQRIIKYTNEIGKKYGKWTILNIIPPMKNARLRYNYSFYCECACGKNQTIDCYKLLKGCTTQCNSCANKINGLRGYGQRKNKKPITHFIFKDLQEVDIDQKKVMDEIIRDFNKKIEDICAKAGISSKDHTYPISKEE